MTIYKLYIKTHNKTGLKYLGFTKSEDPHKYTGSGEYWIPHLKIYGRDYTTEIIQECYSKEEVKEWGLYYSNLWDIVNAKHQNGKKIWANLKPESGEGGSTTEAAKKQQITKKLRGTDKIGARKGVATKRKNGVPFATSQSAAKSLATKREIGSDKNMSKTWKIVNPDGDVFIVKNLKTFCQENNLHDSNMIKVAYNRQSNHKGWMCYPLESKRNQ